MYVFIFFIFGCVGSSFLCEGFLWLRQAGATLHRSARASLSWPLVAEHRLQTRRLSSYGLRAQLLRGMWDLPRPGLEPVSPELAGRFSTTAPPGKPPPFFTALATHSNSHIHIPIFEITNLLIHISSPNLCPE